MVLTIRNVLLLLAVLCFVLAAVGIAVGGVSLTALGLALFAGAFVAPDRVLDYDRGRRGRSGDRR
ncbi:MAG: hypothetical protein M3301_02230 [Chloroflexota bacterium]|nr:hypothetical protein [Chloroflexota bacterium]